MRDQGQPDFAAAGCRRCFERVNKGLAAACGLGGDDEFVFAGSAGQSIDRLERSPQVAREVDFDLPQGGRDVIKGFFFLVGCLAGFDAADLDVIQQSFGAEVGSVAAPISREDADVISRAGFIQPRRQGFDQRSFAGPGQRARRCPHDQRGARIVATVVDDVSDVHVFIIAVKGLGAAFMLYCIR